MTKQKPLSQTPSNNAVAVEDTHLLSPVEFSKDMPFSLGTLNNSRLSGRLMGVPAPKHYRFGRLVRYPASEREAWLKCFHLAATATEHFHQKKSSHM